MQHEGLLVSRVMVLHLVSERLAEGENQVLWRWGFGRIWRSFCADKIALLIVLLFRCLEITVKLML